MVITKEENPEVFVSTSTSSRYSFYISGFIESADKYTDMLNTLRNAESKDEVIFHINSHGGDLFAALQIMHAIIGCEANITCSVEGACMSAATLIFLVADNFYINDHSIFMYHNYSGGALGKGGEIFDQIAHEREWSSKLLHSVYEHFLTKKEIKSLLDNKDIYMDAEEAVKRLQRRVDKLEKKNKLDSQAEE